MNTLGTMDSSEVDLRTGRPDDMLDLARTAHEGLRDLERLAAERRDLAVRVLTAIERGRAVQVPTPVAAALELDGLRDELLDLLGRIHDATDPYTAWADAEPPLGELGHVRPAHHRPDPATGPEGDDQGHLSPDTGAAA